MIVRQTIAGDIPALQSVLEGTELFPSDMLPDMVAPFLAQGASDGLWLSVVDGDVPLGFCYAQPEDLTDGTWNMLAIAVSPDSQRKGLGTALVRQIEDDLRDIGVRILIVDTSGTDDFADTRAFYAGHSYEEEARIRDFWAEGDDKVIFRKAL